MTTPRTEPLTDSDKLLLLAAWFDMWDHPATDRQAILDDPRNPGRNEVQADLRRIAAALASPSLDVKALARAICASQERCDGTCPDVEGVDAIHLDAARAILNAHARLTEDQP